jgi:hypothetical protein
MTSGDLLQPLAAVGLNRRRGNLSPPEGGGQKGRRVDDWAESHNIT